MNEGKEALLLSINMDGSDSEQGSFSTPEKVVPPVGCFVEFDRFEKFALSITSKAISSLLIRKGIA